MKEYSNAFQLALNSDKTEMVLSFIQETPEVSLKDGKFSITGITREEVSGLIISPSMAKNVAENILAILNTGDQKSK